MNEDEMPEASIEFVNYALAHCPGCDAEYEVSTCDQGEIDCCCGVKFSWVTVD